MITFQIEKLDDCLVEIESLLQEHFEEVGTDKDKIVNPKIDKNIYYAMEKHDLLIVLTIRKEKELIGYHSSFIRYHQHYTHILIAVTDAYYLMPKHRKGMLGVKMFKEVEKNLKKRGVKRVFTTTEKHVDKGKIFEYLGWSEIEKTYSKWIGD